MMETCKCEGSGRFFDLTEDLDEISKEKCRFCEKYFFTKEELEEAKRKGYVQIQPYNIFVGARGTSISQLFKDLIAKFKGKRGMGNKR